MGMPDKFNKSSDTSKQFNNLDTENIILKPQEDSLIYTLPNIDQKLSPEEIEYKQLVHTPNNVLYKLELQYHLKKNDPKISKEKIIELENKIRQAEYYSNLFGYYSDSSDSARSSSSSNEYYHYYDYDYDNKIGLYNENGVYDINGLYDENGFCYENVSYDELEEQDDDVFSSNNNDDFTIV